MKEQDCLRRFIFEDLGVRGNWVKLGESWLRTKEHQQAGRLIMDQLGQALAAVTMLSSMVKYKGSMILQVQGNGAIRTLVTQATDERKVRGLVRCNADAEENSRQDLFGEGQMIITIERAEGVPYQGVVSMAGRHFSEALEAYFTQSEQLNTRVWLVVDQNRAAGLLLQELPVQENYKEDWRRIEMLAQTLTESELLELDCEQLLYRLFNQEKVRVFAPEPVEFKCTCSRHKIEGTLKSVGRAELEDILREHGIIQVDCEFCGRHYHFDRVDVDKLLADTVAHDGTDIRH